MTSAYTRTPAVRAVIRNGEIVDGTGGEAYRGSIVIRGGRIVDIARGERPDLPPSGACDLDIDAAGLVVAPGFIDTHIHSDVHLLWDGQHAATLEQGVTTHILGQDGLSYAPLGNENLREFARYLAPVNGMPPTAMAWSTVAEFRSQFDGTVAVNTAYAVPQGTLRFEVAGMANRPLSTTERARMGDLLDRSLGEGGVALSTGLSYFPGSFADTDEIVELARIAAAHDVPYVTHVRSAFTHGQVDPIGEAVDIAKRSGARLHISHWRTTPTTVGRVDQVLETLDAAYESGLPVSLDTYPYLHGSGPLHIGLPGWAFDGGLDATLARLADRGQREALIDGIERNEARLTGILTHVAGHPEYEDRDLREVAAERRQSVADMACDLLLDAELDVTFHLGTAEILGDAGMNRQFEHDCLQVLGRPYAMVGSDGIYVGRTPHERAFGTFAKLLRLAREQAFPLPTLIQRMTKNPADTFSLTGRGQIAVGATADLVAFDPVQVREQATARRPRRSPTGVGFVFVGGELAVDCGHVTGLMAGRALAPHAGTVGS